MAVQCVPQTAGSRRALPWPVLIYLLLVCLPIRFEIGPIQMTGLRLYLALCFLPLLVMSLRQRPPGSDLIDTALYLHILWAALAITKTSPAQFLENTGANTLELLGGYLIARYYIRQPHDLAAAATLVAVLVAVSIPFAVIEGITGSAPIVLMIQSIPFIGSVEVIDIAPRLGLHRAQTMFAHPIHYGLFSVSTFAIIWFCTPLRPTARLLLCAALIAGTFFALSSGALLSLFIQMALIAWIALFGNRPKIWLIFLACVILAYVSIDLLSNRSPLRVFMSYATFSSHNAFWRGLIFEWGMLNVAQNPVFGLGFNDWIRPHYMVSGSLDNFWLTVTMRYGIPAFVLMSIAVGYAVLSVTLAKTTLDPHLRTGWVLAMIGFILALCTVHVWTSIYSYFFFLMGAGLCLRSSTAEQSKPLPSPRAALQFSTAAPPVFSPERRSA